MHKKSVLFVLLICLALPLANTAAARKRAKAEAEPAPAPVAETETSDRLDPVLTVGLLTTEDYVEGIGDILIPLYFTGRALLFINPRASFTDDRAEEFNLGLGYRQLLPTGDGLLGGNIFYDHRNTSRGTYFDQWGLGVEYLSHFLDARANLYIPLNDKKMVDQYSVTEENRSRRVSESEEGIWRDPYATGNDIYQDYDVVRTTVTRTKRTTTTRYFEQYEVALRGWDAEVGIRLPVVAIEDYLRVKMFGGYFDYRGKHGVDDVAGFRGRVELQLRPSVFVDAVYYSNDELTGGNYSLGLYASLPFDVENISKGKNPFAGAMEIWEAGKLRENAAYRLTDMVKRDPQIRTRITEVQEQTDKTEKTSSTKVKSTSETVSSTTESIETDITFVDLDNTGNPGQDGTIENPYETIQGGVNDPRTMVFVHDAAGVYNESVFVTDNVIVRGAGCPLPVYGGLFYGSGIYPIVDGGGAMATFTMGNNTTVKGFEIRNTENGKVAGHGIYSDANNLIIACNYIHSTDIGALIERPELDVNVLLENNHFKNNEIAGALIQGSGHSGFYFVNARDNLFENNHLGLALFAEDYDAALVVLHGNEAYGNEVGILADIRASEVALLSVTDTRLENNDIGMLASVQAVGLAAILGGTPPEMMDLVRDVLENYMEVGPLPEEVEVLLSGGGPIWANNNETGGLILNVQGGVVGLLGLFDTYANNNGAFGALADVSSSDGLAIGLVGSSENMLEVLQLAANVAGLIDPDMELPEIPSTSTGPSQFNDNEVFGLLLSVQGEYLSLAAALGIEANDNTIGVLLSAYSPSGPAIGALARVEAHNNQVGMIVDVESDDDVALGAIFDARATGNMIGAILDVQGESAIGLVGSTDPLRSIADILNQEMELDPPLVIPGSPWGPSVFSDNTEVGLLAYIDGTYDAFGAFMDIHANNNGIVGIDVLINSIDGSAVGLFGSSDVLFELIPPILGTAMGDPDAIPPLPYTPMGYMDVSGNGEAGLLVTVNSYYGANVFAGGILASDNGHANSDSLPSIGFRVQSQDSDVFVGLYDIVANNNANMGIYVEADAGYDATVALLASQANGNADRGVEMNLSADEDIYVILAGMDASGNGMQGIDITADAGWDLAIAATGVNASDNLRHGLLINGTVGGDAFVWIGDLAIDDLRAEFGSFDIFGSEDALYTIMPTGPSTFNNNGWDDDNPGARAGARVNLEVGDGITVAVAGGNAFNNNSGHGINLDLASTTGDIDVGFDDNEMIGNGIDGLRVDANTAGGEIAVAINDVSANNNVRHGIIVLGTTGGGNVSASFRYVQANNNGTDGIRVVLDASAGAGDVAFVVLDSEALDNGRWDVYSRLRYGLGGGAATLFGTFDYDTGNNQHVFVP